MCCVFIIFYEHTKGTSAAARRRRYDIAAAAAAAEIGDARTRNDRYAAAPVFFKGVYGHIDYSAKTGGAWVSAKGQPPPYTAGSSRWGMAKGASCEGWAIS